MIVLYWTWSCRGVDTAEFKVNADGDVCWDAASVPSTSAVLPRSPDGICTVSHRATGTQPTGTAYCHWQPQEHHSPLTSWSFICASLAFSALILLIFVMCLFVCLPSVLWRCWLGCRKGVRPVKKWVVRCSHGYLSEVRCKWFAYGSADATVTSSSLAAMKLHLWIFGIYGAI